MKYTGVVQRSGCLPVTQEIVGSNPIIGATKQISCNCFVIHMHCEDVCVLRYEVLLEAYNWEVVVIGSNPMVSAKYTPSWSRG